MDERDNSIQKSPDTRGEFYHPVMEDFNKESHIKWILSHIFRYKWLLALFFIISTLYLAISAITPLFLGQLTDVILGGGVNRWLQVKSLALLILVLTVVSGLFSFGASIIIEITAQKVERDIRDEFYAAMLSKSMTFHDEVKQGDVMARATFDTRMVNFFVNPVVHLAFQAFVGGLFVLISIGYLSPKLFGFFPILLVIPLGMFIPVYFLAKNFFQTIAPLSMEIQESYAELSSYLQEKIQGITVIKTFAREPYEKTHFEARNDELSDKLILRDQIRAKYYPTLIVGVAVGLSLVLGTILILQDRFTIGGLVSYVTLMTQLWWPVMVQSWILVVTQMAIAGAKRIVSILRKQTIIPEASKPAQVDQLKGHISFENVGFAYHGDKKVINDVNFEVAAGSQVALVGPAGSGKTTLVKLLMRMYDVDEGRITIEGVDVRDLALTTLRRNIGVIEQDIKIFSGTIQENISYGKPEATDQEIVEAAKMAQAHDFISSFEKGYETIVGERGTTLSGGQRQRVAIARMLLANPRILIFDDATSAVDSETEDKINRAINKVLKNRTSFVITHRLSTIRASDLIVVMKRGEIVARGSHEQLLKTSMDYWRIFARFSEIREKMPSPEQKRTAKRRVEP
ncbi:MAG: ABC transporter ATP-binding protein [Candidatus Korarchaeota archaeon]|nr:ABC transporter ATP-binding protein [Candidatus Korarchaeota archaeon]NIU82676.1 ATP-binding cassette domain-containing protein [Candidatus Thorarchaeota archaeon]NIW13150.1 ATP-binding cassette domain-containing protein [Candidatus Thorarchaeota archaeon]NIW51251.1 ATP-binding cassette domain-containing protein [Candidatus Korarchaeota archaeon]